MPDKELRPSIPAPSQSNSTMLDILQQLQELTLKVGAGDMIRGQLLMKLNEIEANTKQVPLLMFRMEKMEEEQAKIREAIVMNTEFRIRMETSQNSRRLMLGLFGGSVGAILATIIGYVLQRVFGGGSVGH